MGGGTALMPCAAKLARKEGEGVRARYDDWSALEYGPGRDLLELTRRWGPCAGRREDVAAGIAAVLEYELGLVSGKKGGAPQSVSWRGAVGLRVAPEV